MTSILDATVDFTDLEAGLHLGEVLAVQAGVRWELGKADNVSYHIIGEMARRVLNQSRVSGNVVATVKFGGRVMGSKVVVHPLYDTAQPFTLTDDGPSIIDLYDGVPVDHEIHYNATLISIVLGLFSDWPRIPGIWEDPFYRCAPLLNLKAANLTISEDLNAITVLKAVDQLAHQVGAQLGVNYGSWYGDSGKRQVVLCPLGKDPAGVFGDLGLPILRRTTLDVDWQGTYSRVKIQGGSSNHGLPQGSSFTGIVGVSAAGGVGDATFVVGIYAGSTLGGVYYLTPDLAFHPLSQNMGVTAICYDPVRHIHYAATDRGVYEEYASAGTSIWKQTGGFTAQITRVFVDTTSTGEDPLGNPTVGAQVYAISKDATPGLSGLFMYPASSPARVRLGVGIDYWEMMIGGDVVGASAISNVVYYVLASDPLTIHRVTGLHLAGSRGHSFFGGTNGYAITDLVRTDGGTYVLTAGGRDGFFFIAGTGSTLTDARKGLPGLIINNVVEDVNRDSRYACTDQGLYRLDDDTWRAVSTVGGMQGVNVSHAAPSPPGSAAAPATGGLVPVGGLLAQLPTSFLAAQGGSCWLSHDDGDLWTDLLKEPVTVGTYLRNTRGAATASRDFLWVIDRDGLGNPTYTLVKRRAPFTPGGSCVFAEVVDISADVNTTVDRASAALGVVAMRYAEHVSTPLGGAQQIETWFDDQNMSLTNIILGLRPATVVRLLIMDDPCGDWVGQTVAEDWYVLLAEVVVDENGGHGILTLSSSTATKRYTAEELGQDVLYTLSRLARYK